MLSHTQKKRIKAEEIRWQGCKRLYKLMNNVVYGTTMEKFRNRIRWQGCKRLYKLMNNVVYGKTMEKFRNRTNVRRVSNEKYYLKGTSKPSYMSQKLFDNKLVAIHKSKVQTNICWDVCIRF